MLNFYLASSPLGQRAKLTLREPFGFNSKSPVESGPVVLPRDCGAQFNQFALGKTLAKQSKKTVGNICRRACEGDSEAQNQLFILTEMSAVLKSRKVEQLLLGNSRSSAHGRMEVNSKWTSHQGSHFELY